MVSNQLLEPHTKNGVSPVAHSVTLAYHSLLSRMNRVDTHVGQYIIHPKVCVRVQVPSAHPGCIPIYTRRRHLCYCLWLRIDCGSSSHQKQSVQCRLFRNVAVLLQPRRLRFGRCKNTNKIRDKPQFYTFYKKNCDRDLVPGTILFATFAEQKD